MHGFPSEVSVCASAARQRFPIVQRKNAAKVQAEAAEKKALRILFPRINACDPNRFSFQTINPFFAFCYDCYAACVPVLPVPALLRSFRRSICFRYDFILVNSKYAILTAQTCLSFRHLIKSCFEGESSVMIPIFSFGSYILRA